MGEWVGVCNERCLEIVWLKSKLKKKKKPNGTRIPMPAGEAGRAYKLHDEMGLGGQNITWNAIKVHNCMQRGITYYGHPKDKIAGVIVKACKCQPYLKCFADDWATITLMKQSLHSFKHNPSTVTQNGSNGDEDGNEGSVYRGVGSVAGSGDEDQESSD
ncbi:hypothetical protein M422DRAFT_245750 [Sphaerobolus stellatus SS14]|nr:hypothetical protein M422DRAFT_245750 [Sphaerobolus stellatus SS14]